MGGRLQLICRPMIVGWIVRACICAALWDSQNGFAAKCGGVKNLISCVGVEWSTEYRKSVHFFGNRDFLSTDKLSCNDVCPPYL